jgi:hypothetical protein
MAPPTAPAPSGAGPFLAPVRAFWERYGRAVTAGVVAVLLIVGVILIRGYWLRVQNERARQELDDVGRLPESVRLEHLEKLARTYAGCEASPRIHYRLGIALRDADRLDEAEKALARVEQDHPGSDLARMASAARLAIVEERKTRAAVAERIRELDAKAKAQRPPESDPPEEGQGTGEHEDHKHDQDGKKAAPEAPASPETPTDSKDETRRSVPDKP